MTERVTTSIERIREQVERVREEHRSAIANGCDGLPVDGICSTCDDTTWPCPVLRLAEKVLKLAEAVEYFRQAMPIPSFGRDRAERILAECAEEK